MFQSTRVLNNEHKQFQTRKSTTRIPSSVNEGTDVINIDLLNILDHAIPNRACWSFEIEMRQFVFEDLQYPNLNINLKGGKPTFMSMPCHRFPSGSQILKNYTRSGT